MPPNVKIEKKQILDTAVSIVKLHGADALNARAIAEALKCSTQPIFSNYKSMDALRTDVIREAMEVYQVYLNEDMTSGKYPPYKGSGMAYIRFAANEKELFKLLFMRDRTDEHDTQNDSFDFIVDLLCKQYHLTEDEAKLFHLEMWAYVHGIAVMFATSYLELEWDLVSKMLTDVYEGLYFRYTSQKHEI